MSAQGTPAGAPAGSPAPVVVAGTPGAGPGTPAPQVVQQQPLTVSYVMPYGGYPYAQAYGGYPYGYPAYQPAPAQNAEGQTEGQQAQTQSGAPQYYYPQQFPYTTSFIAAPQAVEGVAGTAGTPLPGQEQVPSQPQQFQYAYPPVPYGAYSFYGQPGFPQPTAGAAATPAKKATKKKGLCC